LVVFYQNKEASLANLGAVHLELGKIEVSHVRYSDDLRLVDGADEKQELVAAVAVP
jgi:hypothetical protein